VLLSCTVHPPKASTNKIKAIIKSNEYAVIFTEETYFDVVKDYLAKKTEPVPVIMMLPTVSTQNKTLHLISEVVEKAVGINILSKSEKQESEIWRKNLVMW